MATLPEPTHDMFRRVCRTAVANRTEDGAISPQANIIMSYRMLDQTQRFSARLWIDGEIKGANARLDVSRARAWSEVRTRIQGM